MVLSCLIFGNQSSFSLVLGCFGQFLVTFRTQTALSSAGQGEALDPAMAALLDVWAVGVISPGCLAIAQGSKHHKCAWNGARDPRNPKLSKKISVLGSSSPLNSWSFSDPPISLISPWKLMCSPPWKHWGHWGHVSLPSWNPTAPDLAQGKGSYAATHSPELHCWSRWARPSVPPSRFVWKWGTPKHHLSPWYIIMLP